MAKFPEPPSPAALRRRAPAAVRRLAPGVRLWRIYFRAGGHPTTWRSFRFFGPTGARFDHHLPDENGQPFEQDRGILYAALDGLTCFAEVFQRTRMINREKAEPWLVAFDTRRELRLLDLTGLWPTRVGASTAIASGLRARARRWSRVIYLAYPEIEGLIYPSSMSGHAPALALYERAADVMPAHPSFHRALADPALEAVVRNVAFDLGYRLT